VSGRAIGLLFAVGALALAAAIVGLRGVLDERGAAKPATAARESTSRFEGALLPSGVRAPDFSLRDQDGRRVTMREYRGRPVIVTFLYSTCHDTCPAEAQQVKGALDDVGHDVPALAISVKPTDDTPANARRFNAKQGMTGRLRWVLGGEEQLQRLWKGFAILPQTPEREHMARLVLVDRRGMQRVGFPASQLTPERLAHDLRAIERL
jgi:protein SCO1/2